MGWKIVEGESGRTAKSRVQVGYRMIGKRFRIVLTIPKNIYEQADICAGSVVKAAVGTDNDSGLLRLITTSEPGFKCSKISDATDRIIVAFPSWLKLPPVSKRSQPVGHRINTEVRPALEIDLPDWLIIETGDFGSRKKLFKDQRGVK